MTARRLARMRATLDRRQPDLHVVLDEVHKPHNLSAILRTCDAVGVCRAHAVHAGAGLRANPTASAGTGQWVEVTAHASAGEAAGALRGYGRKLIAAHFSERAVDFRGIDYTQPCAVVLGAEKKGVSQAMAARCDAHMVIPMQGLGASLNVSVAAAVILFEAQRQRQLAGMYERVRLDGEYYWRTLFEWLYPRIAARYRRAGQEYPPLDRDGTIAASP